MPRVYKRKTARGSTPKDVLQRAALAVQGGASIRKTAKDFVIDRMTLARFIKKTLSVHWYIGDVINHVPGFPQWFNIVYEG